MKEDRARPHRRPPPEEPGPGRSPSRGPAPPSAAGELRHRQSSPDGPEILRARLDSLRRAQFELEVSRDRYAHLYDFAPVGYLSLNSTGRIVEVNLTTAAMLFRNRATLLGSPFGMYVVKPNVPRFLEHLRRCKESRANVVTE